jgi:hypothetical protein
MVVLMNAKRSSRRIVSMVVTATIAAVASLVTTVLGATPAQAAEGCTNYSGPYWFAAADASTAAGSRKVLAVASPWVNGSAAYIWGYNGENLQQWCLQSKYYPVPDVRTYKFRWAKENTLCLGGGTAQGTQLKLVGCSAGLEFRQIRTGDWEDPNGTDYAAYRFRLWPNETLCLDVLDRKSANGTKVQLFSCNGQSNQLWY